MKYPTIAAVIACALLSTPSRAAEAEPEKDPRVAELEKQTAYYTAKAAAETAKASAINAKLAPLSQFAGDGKTTIDEKAGATEAWFLTRQAVAAAGDHIADKVKNGGPIVVLAGDEQLNFTLSTQLRQEAASISATLENGLAVAKVSCVTRSSSVGGLIPALGAAINLLQSTTDITGVQIEGGEQMLALAVAGSTHLRGKAIVPAALTLPNLANNELAKDLNDLSTTHRDALVTLSCIGDEKSEADAKALLDEGVKQYDAFMGRIVAIDDKGKSQLSDALIAQAIARQKPTVLRVYVHNAGGTIVTRKNLFTALGAPAVGVSGGLVASYSATDPATGIPSAGGSISCATDLRSLRKAHAINSTAKVAASCSP